MSAAVLESFAMEGKSKRGRGRPKGDRDDVSVKVDRSIVAKAKLIAAHKGTTVAEMFSDILQTPVDRAYVGMLRDLEKKEI